MKKTEKNRIIRNLRAVARELKNLPAACQVRLHSNGVEIAGTDTTYYAETDFTCPGPVHLDAHTFIDAWRTLDVQEIRHAGKTETGAWRVEIRTASGSYFHPAADPNERIEFDPVKLTSGGHVSVEDVHSLAPYMCTDDLRPALCGVYCGRGSDGRSYMVATNAHILRTLERKYSGPDVVIPSRGVKMLPKRGAFRLKEVYQQGRTEADYIQLRTAYHAGQDGQPYEEIYLRKVGAKYPDFVAVIPKKQEYKITAPADEFLKAIKAGAKLNSITKQVRISGQGNGAPVQVSAKCPDLEATYESNLLGTATQPEPFEVGYNAEYLETVVKNTGGEVVEIEYSPSAGYASLVNGALVMRVMLNSFA